ncbi:HNH endonuclease [Phytomonospora endophytica]|uniref:HNH nuclease domain-containing protein n=1 Tax=Phytomonospora endophytica TaxID=714109 RepID=A0A841FXS6_9ACTN|nr:HNH endonuclease [Phytomonospora endophytica]MBB6038342.1 hypothetical protein [Phytomonospora endophytica]GIG64272.1 hypothetical protein Pen01_05670 [Phytomonospora endophytica]
MSLLAASGSTRAWRRLRAWILDRDGWTCLVPGPTGTPCGRYARTVDHIVPRAHGGGDEPGNLRAACSTCNTRSGALVRRPGALVVVIGPPCGGKTTRVRDLATEQDAIVDYDDLVEAFGGTRYGRDRLPIRLAGVARAAAVRSLLATPPTGGTVYIVHTAPGRGQVAAYARAGAVFELVDPGREECLRRAARERPSQWARYVADWYTDPPRLPTSAPTAAPSASRW